MSSGEASTDGRHAGLADLVETLHATHLQIRALAGEGVDAVVHPSSGTTYLLSDAQGDLRRLEQVERQHASELAAILDALPAEIALIDQGGIILMVNEAWRAFARQNGLNLSNFAVGSSYLAVCDERTTGGEAAGSEAAASGIRSVLEGRSARFTLEYPCHSPTEPRWFLLTVTRLDQERPSGAVVMHVDVSERYRAHAVAGEWRRRLERLIDQAKVGILLHWNFKPILANRELARMLRYDGPEAIQALESCTHLFAEGERERVAEFNAARLGGAYAPAVYRVEGNRLDGARLVMENRAFTIEWGDRMAVCAMLTDITAQLETEDLLRQSQRLDAIGQLTGGIAHDFNNLLTVILGNAELLLDGLGHGQYLRGLAETTAKAAERGAELTSQLLAFARRQPLDPKVADVHRQIAEMERMLQRTLGEHIDIEQLHHPGLWRAMIDPGQLQNAILNLCINARDAMPEGGKLIIETANVHLDADYAGQHKDVEPGRYVMLAVSDTGTGMDAATLDRAFEPFFTTKEVGKGSGLGLSMVYGFVKQSQGHIRVYSELGQGTTVKLYLPSADGVEEEKDEGAAGATVAARYGRERILVVEDDDMVRGHVASQLTGLGYQVVAVSNSIEAIEVLNGAAEFDLLFTDIVMPGGISGRQLAEQARVLRPTLPVLFTSGYAENAIVHHGRLDPGVDFLAKPYRRQDLALKIRAALERGFERPLAR